MSFAASGQLPPLPEILAVAPAGPLPRKRERTRRQLVNAAARVYSARGVAQATVREIAAAADVTPVTFYNHFGSETEMVQAVGTWVADTLCRRLVASYPPEARGAERLAIGCRRFLWLAEESPPWALLVVDVAGATPALVAEIAPYIAADLRLGIRQRDFRRIAEAAALDLVSGTVMQAMRRLALGLAPAGHAALVVTAILSGLGLPPDEARAIVRRPLPPLA